MEPTMVSCDCGARLKLPASIPAGKTIKCPKCAALLVVPAPIAMTDEGFDPEPRSVAPTPAAASTVENRSAAYKECEYCGESILSTARKCKHCGEFLTAETVPATAKKLAPAGRAAKVADGSDPGPAEYFAAIILPPVGLMIAAIWGLKKQAKAKRMLQVSGLMCLIYGAAAGVYLNISQPETGPGTGGSAAINASAPPTLAPGSVANDGENAPPQGGGRAGMPSSGGEVDLEGQPPIIQQAMKANVRVEVEGGLGSGVVVQRDSDGVLILTNHHVVDLKFARSHGAEETPLKEIPRLKVTYYDQQSNPATVLWMAPEGIDLALIKAKAPEEIKPVVWQVTPRVIPGQDVFAVGNPIGLGWTYTKGVVSATRKERKGEGHSLEVPLIQTDTSITYGNSGGGLYSSESGELIGINSSIAPPSLGKGLGFAIAAKVLSELKPPGLSLPTAVNSK